MPKAVYFPRTWHLWDCQRWADERRLPLDFIEAEHGYGVVWINLDMRYSYAVYGEASR